MEIKYSVTEQLLNIISKFQELHGRVYGAYHFLDHETQRKIFLEAEEIAAFSAVINDIGAMEELSKDWDTSLINKLLSAEDKIYYHNYLSILREFPKLIPIKGNLITSEMLKTIHKNLLSQESSYFRTDTKEISSITIEDGIKYEYQSTVRTHPNAIVPKLNEFSKWLESNQGLNPVILAAITYFKIAEIHPFHEANGRSSKILSRAKLYKHGIDTHLLLTIDDYLLTNQHYYFDIIEQTINSQDLTKWIEFYAKSLLHGVTQTARLIYNHTAGTIDIMENKFTILKPREKEVMQIIMDTQNSSGAEIGRELNMTRQNVNVIIKGLLKKGLIKKIGKNTGVRYIPS
ncbi:MAG TPA: Fic family protein [Candidatus Dojkabacteria bacterium]|nr:Fic family protein [Candidatus Dojkabacteria bacterium]HRP51395.1 Fic family protein [Candidatus Dojkabacteria bacterium]